MPQLLTSLIGLPTALQRGAVSVGNFDGVHRGHAELISRLVASARSLSRPAVVITFDPPPTALLHPEQPLKAPLTTIPRRAELLFALGVDVVLAYPTDVALLGLSAREFFQEILVRQLRAKVIIEGPNFRFGRDRQGDVSLLSELCAAEGIEFAVINAREDPQGMISSTRIRQLLLAGQLLEANQLLTQPYMLEGFVERGAGRGRTLGFPTANLAQIQSFLPSYGVYAGRVVRLGQDSCSLAAAVNLGPNPTFDESRAKVEVHILNYPGEALYGQRLHVELIDKIREVRKFQSLESLCEQVARDVSACANAVRLAGVEIN